MFLCSALLFGLFSLPVSADSIDTSSYKVNIYMNSPHSYGQLDILNGEASTKELSKNTTWKSTTVFTQSLTFADSQGTILFDKGKNYTFSAEAFLFEFQHALSNGSGYPHQPIINNENLVLEYTRLVYSNGSIQNIQGGEIFYNRQNNTYGVRVSFNPNQDVTKINFRVSYSYDVNSVDSALPGTSTMCYLMIGTSHSMNLEINVQSEEAGFLSGILGKITDLWATAEAGFANMVKGITELPQKIWQFIENGLKDLFVPDDQYMASYSDRWSELLGSRLGAVYEVGEIVTDSWDNIMSADQTDTINLPRVTIPLGDSSFSFGGEDIKIVPDGFGALVTALKLIVGIVCTVAFINGLLKRYDEVMGVEK